MNYCPKSEENGPSLLHSENERERDDTSDFHAANTRTRTKSEEKMRDADEQTKNLFEIKNFHNVRKSTEVFISQDR